jgi:hypothetical protein
VSRANIDCLDHQEVAIAKISIYWLSSSVSNPVYTDTGIPVYTDTGIPVFGTPNADTGKKLPVFAGIENVLNGHFSPKLGNIDLIYFVFTCKLALEF